MAPGNYPLDLYRGDSYEWRFRLWDDVDKTEPSDLSGVTPTAQVRDKPDGTVIMDLVCTIEAPNNVDVKLPAEAWSVWTNKSEAKWDLQLAYEDGAIKTMVAGDVTVTLDVTKVAP